MPRTIFRATPFLLLVNTFCFAAEPVTCPATIATRQELKAPVFGWTATQGSASGDLAGITFYDGTPAEGASLVYDKITRGKAEQTATWTFAPRTGRQIWIGCSYSGTSIQLTKSLPASVTTCSVVYDPNQQIAGLPSIKRIACK